MKATFALLANSEISNFVRKLAWDSHTKFHTSLGVSHLPPHISLKQPFRITNLEALETYMGELACSIQPFEITLTELQIIPIIIDDVETCILWVDVQQSDTLQRLHYRVNAGLEQRFSNTQADHNGEEYHFHMTVAIGGQPAAVYRQLYEGLSSQRLDLSFTATELAMFVYDEPIVIGQGYINYRVLPIG